MEQYNPIRTIQLSVEEVSPKSIEELETEYINIIAQLEAEGFLKSYEYDFYSGEYYICLHKD